MTAYQSVWLGGKAIKVRSADSVGKYSMNPVAFNKVSSSKRLNQRRARRANPGVVFGGRVYVQRPSGGRGIHVKARPVKTRGGGHRRTFWARDSKGKFK